MVTFIQPSISPTQYVLKLKYFEGEPVWPWTFPSHSLFNTTLPRREKNRVREFDPCANLTQLDYIGKVILSRRMNFPNIFSVPRQKYYKASIFLPPEMHINPLNPDVVLYLLEQQKLDDSNKMFITFSPINVFLQYLLIQSN